jgi:hypothetical protein
MSLLASWLDASTSNFKLLWWLTMSLGAGIAVGQVAADRRHARDAHAVPRPWYDAVLAAALGAFVGFWVGFALMAALYGVTRVG